MNDPLIPELPDFDDPLGMLHACHERMLAHCDMLAELLPHIAQKGIDDEARGAINRVVKYFTTSAVHHHQDEEQDLFPLLNRQSLKLADIVHRLKKEHVELAGLWDAIAPALKAPSTLADNADLAANIDRFCNLYREHIEFENKELLSIARHILSHRQLEEMGDAMARRRGVHR